MSIHKAFTICLLLLFALAPVDAKEKKRKKGQYKRYHRKSWEKLDKGNVEEALASFQKLAEKDAKDADTHYFLALCLARNKKPEDALKHVKKAVELGLDFGRFLAGPRKWSEALLNDPAFKAYAAEQKVSLIHGPMLGRVTGNEASFWVRTAGALPVQVTVGVGDAFKNAVKSAEVTTKADDDFTGVVTVKGLKPETEYRYQVMVNGKKVGPEKSIPFRTFPKAGARSKFTIAFGGGAGFVPHHEYMWNTIAGRKPLSFLFLGDNVYIDTPKSTPVQQHHYYRRQSRPEYRRFVASSAIYAVWDDHDFSTNDSADGADPFKPSWKLPVWKVFKQNWVNPYYGGGEKQPGCWHDLSIGDVDIFMTDGRYYRCRKSKSMLGKAQKAWLLEKLQASKATFKVIASGVPWSPGTKGKSPDTWDGYPAEREEIFSFLEKNKINGVLLLSADRHRSDCWKIARPNGYDLYEFESSKLTNIHTHGTMAKAVFSYNKKCSVGFLTFDTTKPDPEVTYEIVSIDNEVVHKLTLKGSQLKHRE